MSRQHAVIHAVAEMTRVLGRPMNATEAESVGQIFTDSASLLRLHSRPRTEARSARRSRLLTQILLNAKAVFGPVELEVPSEPDAIFYLTARRPSRDREGTVVFHFSERLLG